MGDKLAFCVQVFTDPSGVLSDRIARVLADGILATTWYNPVLNEEYREKKILGCDIMQPAGGRTKTRARIPGLPACLSACEQIYSEKRLSGQLFYKGELSSGPVGR